MALKDAILETLSCMLSVNSDLRKVAEERNKALEVTEGWLPYLKSFSRYFKKNLLCYHLKTSKEPLILFFRLSFIPIRNNPHNR